MLALQILSLRFHSQHRASAMLSGLNFSALRRRLGVRQSCPDGVELCWGQHRAGWAGDLVLPVTNIRAGGTGTSGWEEEHPLASPQVDLAQDTETLRIMVLLKDLDHRQDS